MSRQQAGDKGRDLVGRAFRPEEMVQHQGGSIVSRQLVSGSGGNVTLFAFDAKEGLSSHTTPFTALAYVLEGEAEITVAGNAVVLKRGEMTLLPADTPHSVLALTPFKMALIMIKS
ncbi:MAG: cupin domain-containing protein [Dehalococcoidia bacterium]|nr:cupin domain-containing protein [Dehalococcoidia bacterium]